MYQRYLEQLKKRSDKHKERFALSVSGGITAIIFVLWASVIVPQNIGTLAQETKETEQKDTPVSVLSSGVAQVYNAVLEVWDKGKGDVKTIDIQSEYLKMKQEVEEGTIVIPPPAQAR